MTIKTFLVALAFVAAPGLAVAEGCMFGSGADTATMSCADGLSFDSATGTCVEIVSS